MDQLENRFIVLKRIDVDRYLNLREQYLLNQILGQIDLGREDEYKEKNEYVVVNLDEPYAQQVVDLVLGGGNMLPAKGILIIEFSGFRVFLNYVNQTVVFRNIRTGDMLNPTDAEFEKLVKIISQLKDLEDAKKWHLGKR